MKEISSKEKPTNIVTKLTPKGTMGIGSGILLAEKLLQLAGQKGYSTNPNGPLSSFDIREVYIGGEYEDGIFSGGELVGIVQIDRDTTRGAPFVYIFDEKGQGILTEAARKATKEGFLFDIRNVIFIPRE